MTLRHRLVCSLASFGIVLGCAGSEADVEPVIVRDSAGVIIVENDVSRLDDVCAVSSSPSVTIGAAGGGPEYELYRVFGASQLSDGRIVLVNQGSQQLRFYDAAGRFEMSAGRAGSGPGEFRDAFHLWVLPGDTIWVGDYRPWQFLVFGPDGRWVRTVRPRPEYPNSPGVMEVLNDGRSILAGNDGIFNLSRQFDERILTVVVHGPGGELQDTIGTYRNGRWGLVSEERGTPGLYPLFESFTRFDGDGERIVVGHGSRPELSVLRANADIRLERLIRWNAVQRPVEPHHVAAEKQRLADQYVDLDAAMRRMLVDPLTSENRPVAESFPVFTNIVAGRDGRIWVREYTGPEDAEAHAWLAFDAEGGFSCRAVFPPVRQVLELGRDYLLVLEEDELDVERVARYDVTSPAQPR